MATTEAEDDLASERFFLRNGSYLRDAWITTVMVRIDVESVRQLMRTSPMMFERCMLDRKGAKGLFAMLCNDRVGARMLRKWLWS